MPSCEVLSKIDFLEAGDDPYSAMPVAVFLTALAFFFFLDPFGGDPFKESDPFKGTSSEDFFKRTDKTDLFGSSDPFGRKPTPPAKVSITSSLHHLKDVRLKC